MTQINATLASVTERIRKRSQHSRAKYLAQIEQAGEDGPIRKGLSCTNLAHAFAAAPDADKTTLAKLRRPNIGIVSAYNDMLSAHQPLEVFPTLIKEAARKAGGTAQFAGGVPAMCDGVTQGQVGMELSLFSRDVIAMSTAIALSHNTFDAALCLGVCDKIVPGLLIGALSFGHLPVIFVPAGPMTSGLPNSEKARIRQLFAEGKIDRDELLAAESKSYHGPGTCTFYGTANSNQMLMELMGLHIPGTAFINPNTPLRFALTERAATQVLELTRAGTNYTPVGRVIDEKAIVNGVVGLLCTGGSTNHLLHLVAIAAAAGVQIDWQDFDELAEVIPLLCRVYPNGKADVNQFHAAGGMAFLVRQLIDAGLVHADVLTVAGRGLDHYAEEPGLDDGQVTWRPAADQSLDNDILRPVAEPFANNGGTRLLTGNLGRAVVKTSAVDEQRHRIEAPAAVFRDQTELTAAFQAGELDRDFVAVVQHQGPQANGMPELHKLMPPLGVLQDRGHQVALVTDGRMSGASGKVLCAIHLTPESIAGGPLAKVRDGDLMRIDAKQGTLDVLVDADEFAARQPSEPLPGSSNGCGRELFGGLRALVGPAEQGASVFTAQAD